MISVPVPAGGIGILKRPPFHGIVQKPDRPWREAALLLARVRRDQVSIPRVRAQSPRNFGFWGMGPQGDHGVEPRALYRRVHTKQQPNQCRREQSHQGRKPDRQG